MIFDGLDQFIFDLLALFGSLSTSQITHCTHMSRRSVINRLSSLIERGKILELAHSPNDPKKKYSLKASTKEASKKHMIELIQWYKNPVDGIGIQFKVGKKSYINLAFSKEIIDDFFLDRSIQNQEEAKKKVGWIISCEPIFEEILFSALGKEEVKADFKKGQMANYYVSPEDFLRKDYRKKELSQSDLDKCYTDYKIEGIYPITNEAFCRLYFR